MSAFVVLGIYTIHLILEQVIANLTLQTRNTISDEDVEFDVLRENFGVYDLSNSMMPSLKTILAQVRKSRLVVIGGEPIYLVTVNPVIKIKKR